MFCEVDCFSVQHLFVGFNGCGGGKSVAGIASTLVLDGSDETFCLPVHNSGQVGQSVLKSSTPCGPEVQSPLSGQLRAKHDLPLGVRAGLSVQDLLRQEVELPKFFRRKISKGVDSLSVRFLRSARAAKQNLA